MPLFFIRCFSTLPCPRKHLIGFLSALCLFVGCSPIAPDTAKSSLPLENSQPASLDQASRSSIAPEKLRSRIDAVLQENLTGRQLSASTNAAWQIMHGVLAYRDRLPLTVENRQLNTLEHLFHGGVVNGWDLAAGEVLPKTQRLGMRARLEPGSYIGQGHVDQWLAILAQIDVPLTETVQVQDRTFTIEDWARQAQYDVSHVAVREYSWTLMALMHYFPDEQTWVAKDGKQWTFDPLVEFEAKEDLRTSPCGGMHRMMGLAHAIRFRKRHGGEMTGAWKLADDRIREVIALAKQYQNEDGSFSSNYTERPGRTKDLSATISATGHTLEFLAYALPENELSDEWMEKATQRLCTLLEASRKVDLDCGGLYHALNGLRIYHDRRFGVWTPN